MCKFGSEIAFFGSDFEALPLSGLNINGFDSCMPESVFFVHPESPWTGPEKARKGFDFSPFFFSDFDFFHLGIRVSRMMMAMKVPVSGLGMASPSSLSMVVPGRRVLVANPASRTSFFNGGGIEWSLRVLGFWIDPIMRWFAFWMLGDSVIWVWALT